MASMFDIEGLSDAKSFGDGADLYSTVEEVFSGGNSLIVQPEPFTHKKIYVDLSRKSSFQVEFKELEGYNGNISIHLDNTIGVTGIIDSSVNVTIKGGTLSQSSTLKVVAGTSYMLTAKYSDGSCIVDYKTDISAPPTQFPLDVDIALRLYNETREEYVEDKSFKITSIDKYPCLIPIPDLGENVNYNHSSSSSWKINMTEGYNEIIINGLRYPEEKYSIPLYYAEEGVLLDIRFLNVLENLEMGHEQKMVVRNHRTYVKLDFEEEYRIVEIVPPLGLDDKISFELADEGSVFYIISQDIYLNQSYHLDVLLEPRKE